MINILALRNSSWRECSHSSRVKYVWLPLLGWKNMWWNQFKSFYLRFLCWIGLKQKYIHQDNQKAYWKALYQIAPLHFKSRINRHTIIHAHTSYTYKLTYGLKSGNSHNFSNQEWKPTINHRVLAILRKSESEPELSHPRVIWYITTYHFIFGYHWQRSIISKNKNSAVPL